MKKTLIITIVLILSTVFVVSVSADQAAYITEKQAKKAVKLLMKKKQIIHFCEPCGDTEIRTEDIETIEAVKTDTENYWEVKVNGKGIDLAYTYYKRKKNKWKNVAMKLKIDVSDVSEYIPADKLQ